MNEINFKKIQATGNDFVVVDYESVPGYIFEKEKIQKLCNRNFGIGADGLIALQKLEKYAFQFHYFNSDGSRAAMCGNGLRAALCFAQSQQWISGDKSFEFLADDGVHKGQLKSDGFKVNLIVNEVADELNLSEFTLPDWIDRGFTINTGVPHLVLLCSGNIAKKEIFEIGKYLRFHKKFSPNGTNVNFVEVRDDSAIYVRTYERGVENETLSCGTGITASAIVMKTFYNFPAIIAIETNGGNLKVSFENDSIDINGPAEIAFNGTIRI